MRRLIAGRTASGRAMTESHDDLLDTLGRVYDLLRDGHGLMGGVASVVKYRVAVACKAVQCSAGNGYV